MLVLDINDAEIVLTRDGNELYSQPGVARVTPKATVFGHAALGQSRLHPQQSHNEYWHRLNADPVTPHGRGVGNQADLVYLQLQEIRATTGEKRPSVVVVAPSAVTADQFAILLGITAEAGFDVRAIVDASVAFACRQTWESACRVVDVSLQRATVAQLERVEADAGAVVRRTAVDEFPAAGFAALAEGWIDAVADRFVDGTRFDPLRIAQTEQQVFDQLMAGIETGAAEFSIEVSHNDITRRVSVSRQALATKSRQRYELFARALGGAGTLAVSHRALRLPGLAAFLQEAGHHLLPLPANALAATIRDLRDFILAAPDGGSGTAGVRLVAALPAATGPAAAPLPLAPTHVLCKSLAMPLADGARASDHPAFLPGSPDFQIKRRNDAVLLVPTADAAVSLNGLPIDFEHPVATGDTIEVGNLEFRLIATVDGDDRGHL